MSEEVSEPQETTVTETPRKQPEKEPEKITAPVKSVRQKDPRRVAAGKKLAAISKAAKEKKARDRFMAEEREVACDKMNNAYILGLGVLGLGLGYCLLGKKSEKEEPEKDEKEPRVINREKRSASPPPPSTSRLDSFD